MEPGLRLADAINQPGGHADPVSSLLFNDPETHTNATFTGTLTSQ